MLDWLKSLGPKAAHHGTADAAVAGPQRAMSGKYLLLYEYLENRYANTVVLTFAEIEDLLGFTLPDLAGSRREWWTDANVNTAAHYSDSWVLASRTATPNLVARTVAFERAS
jgi:hypothetical protein